MTTVSSPGSSPVTVYNLSGTTVDVLAATGTIKSTAAPITRYTGYTIVQVTGSGSANGIKLPINADIGDVVEIFSDQTFQVTVYTQGSETILGAGGSGDQVGLSGNGSFRKLTSLVWGYHSS